jgi:hypothetical protein
MSKSTFRMLQVFITRILWSPNEGEVVSAELVSRYESDSAIFSRQDKPSQER